MKTFEDYKEEIKLKYEREKGGELSGYLCNPSPAKIRDACIYLLNNKKSVKDQNILKNFFEYEENENKISIIKKHDIDKLRPLSNFLKGKTIKIQSHISLNLIALLIDFNHRPYIEYRKNGVNYSKINDTFIDVEKTMTRLIKDNESSDEKNNINIIKIAFTLVSIIIASLIIYSSSTIEKRKLWFEVKITIKKFCLVALTTIYSKKSVPNE